MFADCERFLDAPAPRSPGLRGLLTSFGHHRSLVDILDPLYALANGGTFFGGLFRTLPLVGIDDETGRTVTDTVTAWNDRSGWKRWHPFFERNDAFVLASSALGDVFGVALGPDGAVVDARVVQVRTSAYEVNVLDVAWPEVFSHLEKDAALRELLLDSRFALSAIARHGRPSSSEVLSWNVPPRLGGARSADNLEPRSLSVHVDFTLQLLHQALVVHRLAPGTPLPRIECVETADGEFRVLLSAD